jgi:hypothetical protein
MKYFGLFIFILVIFSNCGHRFENNNEFKSSRIIDTVNFRCGQNELILNNSQRDSLIEKLLEKYSHYLKSDYRQFIKMRNLSFDPLIGRFEYWEYPDVYGNPPKKFVIFTRMPNTKYIFPFPENFDVEVNKIIKLLPPSKYENEVVLYKLPFEKENTSGYHIVDQVLLGWHFKRLSYEDSLCIWTQIKAGNKYHFKKTLDPCERLNYRLKIFRQLMKGLRDSLTTVYLYPDYYNAYISVKIPIGAKDSIKVKAINDSCDVHFYF